MLRLMEAAPSLAERRKALGLSQEQLALLLGVTQGSISRHENGSNARTDPMYALSLDALAMRKDQGEDLAATAADIAKPEAAAA